MIYQREILLIGEENLKKLNCSTVAVFGVGGVGGFVVEALARSGVGNIVIFDNDDVSESNINRQIIADTTTVGKDKVSAVKERIYAINPAINVTANKVFFLPENADKFDFSAFDYVVDAVDTVSAKLEIIMKAKKAGVPVISCMGTGGKVDIQKLKVCDIKDTGVCPLARVMRKELKDRNIKDVKVVFSTEEAVKRNGREKDGQPSMIFVPAAAGLMLAKEVVFDLIGSK